jgi:hypothetical protein
VPAPCCAKVFPVFVTQEDRQRIPGFKLGGVVFLVFDLAEQPLERMGTDRNARSRGDLFTQVDKMRVDPLPAASPLQLLFHPLQADFQQ